MAIDHGGAVSTAAAERTECTDRDTLARPDAVQCEAVEPVHVPESALTYGRDAFDTYRATMAAHWEASAGITPTPVRFDDLDECEQHAWAAAAVRLWNAGHDVAARVSQAVRTAEGRLMMAAMQSAVGAATHAALDQAYERGGIPATVSQLDPAEPTQEGSQ